MPLDLDSLFAQEPKRKPKRKSRKRSTGGQLDLESLFAPAAPPSSPRREPTPPRSRPPGRRAPPPGAMGVPVDPSSGGWPGWLRPFQVRPGFPAKLKRLDTGASVLASLVTGSAEELDRDRWKLGLYGDAGFALWGKQPGDRATVPLPEGLVEVEVQEVRYLGGRWTQADVRRYMQGNPQVRRMMGMLQSGDEQGVRRQIQRRRDAATKRVE